MCAFRYLLFLLIILTLVGCSIPTAAPTTIPPGQEPGEEIVPTETSLEPTEEMASTELSVKPTAAMTQTVPPPVTQSFLDKPSPQHIRLLNYNVNWDSIFPDDDPQNHEWRTVEKVAAFRRLIGAVQPDIARIQEINPVRDPGQVSAIFDETLPLDHGEMWRAISYRDNVIVSRYDLAAEGYELLGPPGYREFPQAAALVDLPDAEYGIKDIYLVCVHFQAFGGEEDILIRQHQADVIISQVRDFRTPGGQIDLPSGTPFIFTGDFNIYETDPAYHLTTLLTGDIIAEELFGGDLQPDWDDTSLTDAMPGHNGLEEDFYTWRDDESGYNPGLLDRIIYSDSVMWISNAFILNTSTLSEGDLAAFGLRADDIMMKADTGYYDHLPIVADFVLVEVD
jgi:endonuclease/exonuclease/phosphatase family metal-dependent hydrolase